MGIILRKMFRDIICSPTRGFLVLGNILGLPVPDEYGNWPKQSCIQGLQLIYGILMGGFTFLAYILLIIKWTTFSAPGLTDILGLFFYATITNLYAYIFKKRERLSKIIKKWSRYIHQPNYKDPKERVVFTSLALIFLTAIVETILFDVDLNQQDIGVKDATFLEKYFDIAIFKVEKLGERGSLFRDEFFLTIIYLMTKIASIASDYGDALCILLSYKIASFTSTVNEQLAGHRGMEMENEFENSENAGKETKTEIIKWPSIYQRLMELRNLADEISKFLSPIFLSSIIVTVLLLVANLNKGVNPSYTMVSRETQIPYIVVSCLHFATRIGFLIHFVSKVHRTSEETLDIIENIPLCSQTWPVERILQMLRRKPIGITFFDTILITRNIFISILSFVFTIQIMILQATTGYSKNDY